VRDEEGAEEEEVSGGTTGGAKEFTGSLVAERTLLSLGGAAMCGALLLSWMFLRADDPARPDGVFTVAAVSFEVLALLTLFLYLRYRLQLVVKEKEWLAKELVKARTRALTLEREANALVMEGCGIVAGQEARVRQWEWDHERERIEWEKHRARSKEAEQAELRAALAQMQTRHMQDGLRACTLANAKVPGVGPQLKRALATHGILHAGNVSAERVQAVPGFGDAKTWAMMQWRHEEERRLLQSQPRQVPADVSEAIRSKHRREREGLIREEEASAAALQARIMAAERDASERLATNEAEKAKITAQLAAVRAEENEQARALRVYKGVTFRAFLRRCLQPASVSFVQPEAGLLFSAIT
jgi:hypothetical protein